ncbi:hypothetical protein [Stenotrophomonas sp.]|uniref:hypothetical protein n=1 Tax=Stenotrophomonas sp. TaxID=69392 RepID=UPI0028B23CE0|nr:hypothetical protein [Stenotrophomonas sp.]
MDAIEFAMAVCIDQWERNAPEARCAACLEALNSPAMTDSEKAVYDSQRAAEMHKAELRRTPSPQLDLRA